MLIDKHVPIPTSDSGVQLANIYRPNAPGKYPVVMAHGVYGKDVHFADAFQSQWEVLKEIYPEIDSNGSSGKYLRWETVDPERWVPQGYVVIQVDARGTGASPGIIDPLSPDEIQDYYEAIEWAGTRNWSNGKVGLIGVSYYAINQWLVAAKRPSHLAAIIPWEGGCDHYRDWSHHGGILSRSFLEGWWPRQILVNQHGNADTTHIDRETGEPTTGIALSKSELEANHSDYIDQLFLHPLNDDFHKERTPILENIEVPMLSAGNWGGPGVHLRGNIEAYLRSGSKHRWLSMHTGTHFESFYLPEFVKMQQDFFDCFLKINKKSTWLKTPPVRLVIRHPEYPRNSKVRYEKEFPLARTQLLHMHLNAKSLSFDQKKSAQVSEVSYLPLSSGIDFSTLPFSQETEVTGFINLKLWISSHSTDMDLFVTLRVFNSADEEVNFTGAHELTPMARGWLRASHRAIDKKLSKIGRVFRQHHSCDKLIPHQIIPVDIEIWPTSMVFPVGYRLVLTITGKDFEIGTIPGRILHNYPPDREPIGFHTLNTIYTGGKYDSILSLPVIPI